MLRRPALAFLVCAFLVGCHGGSGPVGGGSGRLNAGGSSFVYPIMSKWASEYAKAHGLQVNYQPTGSGAGIQQVTAKTYDFGCTDSPMNEEQLKKARDTGGEVLHIPLVMGAVAIAYNLEGLQQPLKFTGPVVADIYLGKIKKWNDPALAALNSGTKLPDQDINVVHRSDGSGTTYIFADYLSKVSEEWKTRVGVGTAIQFPTGNGQKGTAGVAGQVKRTAGSIGYIELIYALENKISFGSLRNRAGVDILPSLESVTAAAAETKVADDLRYSLTDAAGKDAYPISGTTWAVLYANQPADKGKRIVEFLRWATHEGQEYAQDLKYARLPKRLVERVEKKLDEVKFGQ